MCHFVEVNDLMFVSCRHISIAANFPNATRAFLKVHVLGNEIVAQLVKKFLAFNEAENLLPCP
jgi:hypothetical protein